MFVGAPGLEESVYVYDQRTGASIREINVPPAHALASGSFGDGLAYANGHLAITDPSYTNTAVSGFPVGQAYVFDVEGNATRIIPNPESNPADILGVLGAVTSVGNRLFVGSIADNSFAGRVWAFDQVTGEVEFTIENPRPDTPSPLHLGDWFAVSVAANERHIVVGAVNEDSSGVENGGAAYVFDAETGALVHTLFSPNPEERGEFGFSVALTPTSDIVVGAWLETVDEMPEAGRVYVFDGHTGALLDEIANPEPTENALFGRSIAATGGKLFVGAMSADVGSVPSAGAVYAFTLVYRDSPSRGLIAERKPRQSAQSDECRYQRFLVDPRAVLVRHGRRLGAAASHRPRRRR